MNRNVTQRMARKIMGRNFFGVEGAIKHFDIKPTRRQLAILSEIPFSKEVLEQTKDTHVLVAVFPLSIIDIWKKVTGKLYGCGWHEDELFANRPGRTAWQLIKKPDVGGAKVYHRWSTYMTWQEQKALITKDEKVPTAQVVAYTAAGYYLATDDYHAFDLHMRTATRFENSRHVTVSFNWHNDLVVTAEEDDRKEFNLAVASCRQPTVSRS